MSTDPREILAELGLSSCQTDAVLTGNARVLLLMMSAHMDWDWLLPFPLLVGGDDDPNAESAVNTYFGSGMAPAASILEEAADLLGEYDGYRYSVCEMGFLRAFAEAYPDQFAAFAASSSRVHLSGAGITSPDNLLPHGETFIRNYLVGRAWAGGALPDAAISQSYFPDDFGHDPELPVALQAMGMAGTAFARIPGSISHMNPSGAANGTPLEGATLVQEAQIDFIWSASDGSTVLAHFMADWYGGPGDCDVATPATLKAFLTSQTRQNIFNCSPTRYVYVPLANDFQTPIPTLASTCAAWNENPPEIGGATVFCAAATFDQFVQLATAAGGLVTLGPGGSGPFYSTPYYCGGHATRPPLKILHQRATRALLAAEAFGVMAESSSAPVASGPSAIQAKSSAEVLLDAWNLLVPSTHHDFITGTAHPCVYHSEQLPLLGVAVSVAEWVREDAMAGVAATLAGPVPDAVAVFNALGVPRAGALVECDRHAIGGAAQITCGSITGPVQQSAEGTALFLADLPAMGCATAFSSEAGSYGEDLDRVSVTRQSNPDQVTLENARLRVVVGAASGDIVSFFDKAASREVLPVGETANTIAIFSDGGNEYVFGCEMPTPATFADLDISQTVESVDILEPVDASDPGELLRGRVRVTSSCASPDGSGRTLTYTREYALVSGEAMLRMELTGCAPMSGGNYDPIGTTVMVKLPLGKQIDTLARGTPAHWTEQMPPVVWEGMTTYASHHYAIASAAGEGLAGVLHADVHAWGLWWTLAGEQWTNDGVLYGALLRNTNGSYYRYDAADGTDPGVHTRRYAMIPPSACGDPSTAGPLLAGLQFATEPTVTRLNQYLDSEYSSESAQRSLARVTTPESALLTAAKLGTRIPGALILRVYQPTNAPLSEVAIEFDPATVPGWTQGSTVIAQLVTALEEPAGGDTPEVSGSTVTFDMPYAVATLALSVTRS